MKKIQKSAVRFDNLKQDFLDDKKYSGTAEATLNGYRYQKPEAFTALADPVLEQTEGKALDSGYDFGEYRERVNRYIMEHRNDTLAIHKLTQNIPLSQGDYIELEHIFTSELGSKEDYAREYGNIIRQYRVILRFIMYALVAQPVEHLTFNQRARDSNSLERTKRTINR